MDTHTHILTLHAILFILHMPHVQFQQINLEFFIRISTLFGQFMSYTRERDIGLLFSRLITL